MNNPVGANCSRGTVVQSLTLCVLLPGSGVVFWRGHVLSEVEVASAPRMTA